MKMMQKLEFLVFFVKAGMCFVFPLQTQWGNAHTGAWLNVQNANTEILEKQNYFKHDGGMSNTFF